MKSRPRSNVKSLALALAFLGLGCMWWLDHHLLHERFLAEQETVELVSQQNLALRQSVRSGQKDIDRLFAKSIQLTDVINQQKTLSIELQKRLDLNQ